MNAKQTRLKRRERIRELNRTGKAYAVIDGKVAENVEVPGSALKVSKRAPVTLDGKTFREVREPQKEQHVLGGEFEALIRMWASVLNAAYSRGGEKND